MVLEGIRVIDMSVARAGPTAVRQLADFGASVIRIEGPDDAASIARDHNSSDYINLHGNKRLMTLDLKSPASKDIFHKLLERTDVFVENFRPPVKVKLGIDYAHLASDYPRLVYGSSSGFGQSGPTADKGAVDQIIQGSAGLMSLTGTKEQGPLRAGIAVADMAAGMILANGILLALMERERTGLGQWVQVSLLEAMISFLDFQAVRWTMDGEVAEAVGNDHPTLTPMGTFSASDGYLNVAAPSDRLWSRLCDAIGAPGLLADEEFSTATLRHQHKERLKKELQSIFIQRTRSQWVKLLDEVGVPCGPVNSIDEVFADPQVLDLKMTESVDHAVRGQVSVLRNPLTLSRSDRAHKTSSPLPGQHTDEILSELGYSPETVAEFHSSGVV
jgi:crotonobetainyl-CoA:carnitine CoA-transferase CaiB-like acyl-CoA transferase